MHGCEVTSVVSDSVTQWTVACQAPLSMRFPRQEYWSGLPCPPPGNLPNPGIEPRSFTLKADSLPSEPPGKPKILEWPIASPRDLSDPGIELESPALKVDSLPAELPGKPLTSYTFHEL